VAEMSLGWSGRGGDAGSCAMHVQQGSVALGESPRQLHTSEMVTTSLDVIFPVGASFQSYAFVARGL
jgi:hypothetical protein